MVDSIKRKLIQVLQQSGKCLMDFNYLNRFELRNLCIPLLVLILLLVALDQNRLSAAPQAISEVTASYNTITLTHEFDHQDDVQVFCNGAEEQPLRFNVLTNKHNTTIFRPEGTICNISIGEPQDDSAGGFELGSTLVVETLKTPKRPVRATRYFVSPDGSGVSESLANPGSLVDTLDDDLDDVEIFFLPGVYQNTGEIRADNLRNVSLIGNGAVVDGARNGLSGQQNDSWIPIGNGVWENTDPQVVDPYYFMMLFDDEGFGTGTVIQHAGTSSNRAEVHTIDFDCYWSTSPDRTTWWIRLENDESPAEHEMVRFSKEYCMQFNNATDLWIEDLLVQNYAKVTSSVFARNRCRMLEFLGCNNVVVRNVDTRHSAAQAMFFYESQDMLIDGCKTEHRRYLTHNRQTLKTVEESDEVVQYGWEGASSAIAFDCSRVVARGCSVYGVSDWCHLHDCSNVDIHDNFYERVYGETLAINGDSRNIHFWNNAIVGCESQGPFNMQAESGPVWFINNGVLGAGGWTPKETLSGVVPKGDMPDIDFRFLGWGGSQQKFNRVALPLIGQAFFLQNTAILSHTFEERFIWDARQSAFSFGSDEQVHTDTRSRNNIWASSGIVFWGGNPLDNIDFDYDQLWAGDVQGVGWKYLYPHSIHVENQNENLHNDFESFREASQTYQNFAAVAQPILDARDSLLFQVVNRAQGVEIPGVSNNPVFNSPDGKVGAYLLNVRRDSFQR